MSPMKAIKTFRDMLSFFTIIPLGKTEDFVLTTAEHISLFPLIGAFVGLLGAGYFLASSFVTSYLLLFINFFVQVPAELLLKLIPATMTVAFLLVLTGLQHFDGLVDLGNALGLGNLEERRAAAHRWVVSYKGALLAIVVESLAFVGLVLLSGENAFLSLIVSEVGAKLAIVTIAVVGKPTHKGLGSIFLENAKRKSSIIAYFIAALIAVPLLGLIGLSIILISVLFGVLMGLVGKSILGGVSGDMMGATNELVRAAVLVFAAGAFAL
jgi:adenosylcobinamide-GDP ribazoletransferase